MLARPKPPKKRKKKRERSTDGSAVGRKRARLLERLESKFGATTGPAAAGSKPRRKKVPKAASQPAPVITPHGVPSLASHRSINILPGQSSLYDRVRLDAVSNARHASRGSTPRSTAVQHVTCEVVDATGKLTASQAASKLSKKLLLDNAKPEFSLAQVQARQYARHNPPTKKCSTASQPSCLYRDYLPLHALWNSFHCALVASEGGSSSFMHGDLHGAIVEVTKCLQPAMVGEKGIVIKTGTASTSIVTPENRLLRISNSGSEFRIDHKAFSALVTL